MPLAETGGVTAQMFYAVPQIRSSAQRFENNAYFVFSHENVVIKETNYNQVIEHEFSPNLVV